MTSRERVIAAINHQQPDRVPIGFGATGQTGINVCAECSRRNMSISSYSGAAV